VDKICLLFLILFVSCSNRLILMTDTMNDAKELKNRGYVIVSIDSLKKAGYSTIYTIKYREK